MKLLSLPALTAVLILAGLCPAHAAPSAAGVKAQAVAAVKLLDARNYEAYVDCLYPTAVDKLGGRREAPSWISQNKEQLIAQHWKTTREVGEPSAPVTAGGKAFSMVPLLITMVRPGERSVTHSYFVAVSTDGGATWKFVDATTEDPDSIRMDYVPDLPASVKLPEHEDPQLTNE